MSDRDGLRRQVYANMQLRTTEELLEIWEKNDRGEWSDIAFNVVKKILKKRLGNVPEQPPPSKVNRVSLSRRSIKNTSRLDLKNRPLFALQVAWVILFFLLLISKTLLTSGEGGLSNPPVIDFMVLIGFGIIWLSMSIVITYSAWTHDDKTFRKWSLDQSLLRIAWVEKLARAIYSDSFILWNARLGGPIAFLFGIAVFGFVLFRIFESLLK
jgi:hypothetical protein